MQNRAQMKESKCAKDIPKCANEKRRNEPIHGEDNTRIVCPVKSMINVHINTVGSPRTRNKFNQVIKTKRFDGVFLYRKVF